MYWGMQASENLFAFEFSQPRGQNIKIPPLKNQGWDTVYVFHGSTLVAAEAATH